MSKHIPHIIEKVMFSPWLITVGGFESVQMLIASKLAETYQQPVWPQYNAGQGIVYTNSNSTAVKPYATNVPELLSPPSDDWQGTNVTATIDNEGIATIPIRGVLGQRLSGLEKVCGGTDYLDIQQATTEALEKRNAKGVLYLFDSSGGMVRGCSELADYIKGLPVPTQAYTDSRCNSAAYWLASGCQDMMASASSDVGSIGVILPWIDKAKVWELEGLSYNPFVNEGADLKGAGAGPSLTDAQKRYLQESVNYVGEKFQQFVKSNRSVKAEVFRAGTYFGEQAFSVGLIDGVGTQKEAYDKLLTRVKNGDRAPVPSKIQAKRNMTKDELKAQFPELYESMVQENENAARAALESARAQERTRLAELDALAFNPECKAIVEAAKTDGRTAQAIGVEVANLLAKENEHLQLKVGVYKGASATSQVASVDPMSYDARSKDEQLSARFAAVLGKRLAKNGNGKN